MAIINGIGKNKLTTNCDLRQKNCAPGIQFAGPYSFESMTRSRRDTQGNSYFRVPIFGDIFGQKSIGQLQKSSSPIKMIVLASVLQLPKYFSPINIIVFDQDNCWHRHHEF